MTRRIALFLLSAAVLPAITNVARAAEPTYTTITVEKMCCKGCAQKIAGQMYTIKGVKEVRFNIKNKKVYVLPQQSVQPSPRAMWEAVVRGDDKPVHLTGPGGTFKEKPGT